VFANPAEEQDSATLFLVVGVNHPHPSALISRRLAFPVEQYRVSQIIPDSAACSSLNVSGGTLAIGVERGYAGSPS
jgi:hypothetical protein